MPAPRNAPPASSGPVTLTIASRDKPAPAAGTYGSVACPFCGLLCDDLDVRSDAQRLTVTANGCERAKAGFEAPLVLAPPAISGKPVSLDAAVARARELLAASQMPLFGGLGTDVEGMRALLSLADRTGGVVDHVLSRAQYRNTNVLQTRGWFMSTLTEVRNRADLVVIVASDLATHHPRFVERILSPTETMVEAPAGGRTVVLLGAGMAKSAVTGAQIGTVIDLPCAPDETPAVLATLRTLLRGAPATATGSDAVPLAALADLADRCRKAHYAVFVWAPQALDFTEADSAVHMIAEVVRDLNKSTRAAGLSLGGNDGGASAASVCSWQSGYPLRVSFAGGKPSYDPYRFEIARMLEAGEGDLLVWTASFGPVPAPPPATRLPTIVLGAPGIALDRTPDVFIPVGTPGLDHGGRLVRCDSVVSLPLRALRDTGLPSVADIATALGEGLAPVAATAAE